MHSIDPPATGEFEVVRDPVWNTIRVDPVAVRLIDTPEFQRLRHIRQLGLAHLVYPGATHTRFDHALGVYHLTRRALSILGERGELDRVDPEECRLAPYAALLHDIGHYPFSHALEELDPERLPIHHEAEAERYLRADGIRAPLEAVASDGPARVAALIRGGSTSALQGLVSGSLDLDKIEYLRRDARFCGVPYGEVDVDRLLHALTLLQDPGSGRWEVGIHEKGLSAMESLLFSKYQMFRNVYWHHAVRAATVLYLRLTEAALEARLVEPRELSGKGDEELLVLLDLRARRSDSPMGRAVAHQWLPALRSRKLPKRALEISGGALGELPAAPALSGDPVLRKRLEAFLAREMELPPESVFVDYPEKSRMMELDLLTLRRGGAVERLTPGGTAGLIDLPRIAHELYHTARVLRVFTLERRTLAPERVLPLLSLPPEELRLRL